MPTKYRKTMKHKKNKKGGSTWLKKYNKATANATAKTNRNNETERLLALAKYEAKQNMIHRKSIMRKNQMEAKHEEQLRQRVLEEGLRREEIRKNLNAAGRKNFNNTQSTVSYKSL